MPQEMPNILVIWGDDMGITNLFGLVFFPLALLVAYMVDDRSAPMA